jgi:hypothetical protein
MLDTKANVEDVNKVLVDVCRELEQKASATALSDALRDQAIVNAGLCADMSFGRWIWRSGKTKTGRGIPWNVQTINSDPDNFVWEKDKVNSLTSWMRMSFAWSCTHPFVAFDLQWLHCRWCETNTPCSQYASTSEGFF